MKRIKYTPDAADKLRAIKKGVAEQYGQQKAKTVIERLTNAIKGLSENENKGPSVASMFDVKTDYRYLVVSPNYVFYRSDDSYIYIINIYHEREDFMRHLFGIVTTSQETLDYWGE